MSPSPDVFDRSFSTRSSASELSPFRKFNISPPQLSIFNVEQFRVWALAFHAHLSRFHMDKVLLSDANISEDLSASVAEIGQLIHHAVKPATQGSDFSASTLRSLLNLALLQNWSPSCLMERMRRHLGLTSAHELETLETALFSLSPTAGEPLSTFLLRFSVLIEQHNSVAAQQELPSISDRKLFHRLSQILTGPALDILESLAHSSSHGSPSFDMVSTRLLTAARFSEQAGRPLLLSPHSRVSSSASQFGLAAVPSSSSSPPSARASDSTPSTDAPFSPSRGGGRGIY